MRKNICDILIKTSEILRNNELESELRSNKTNQESSLMKKMQRYASKRLSKKERRVDALALRADERRDKLRKATGRCK